MKHPAPTSTSSGRFLWIAAGLACVGLGAIGAVLPGLPTTIFLIGASYCFARSSPRLHGWLLNHPHLGPPLRAWQADRALPVKAKAGAIAMMWTSVLLSCLALAKKESGWILIGVIVVLAVIGTVVVGWVVRTRKPAE